MNVSEIVARSRTIVSGSKYVFPTAGPSPFSGQRTLTGRHPACTAQRRMGTWTKIRPKRLKVITMDVTGTVVSFRGTLEEHYLGAAARCGVSEVNATKINKAFARAYRETSEQYPCFGGDTITAKEWWRETVVKSFRYAGCEDLDSQTEDMIFQRIYSTFGSNAAYEIFPDAQPFLHWARRHGLVCGVLSNADERYGDSILPMLGLTHDDLQFQIYSKDVKMEKPDARVFMAAMNAGRSFLPTPQDVDPSHILHIGNHFQKDFEGARAAGMHSVLLDRYGENDLANEWRRRGAPVFKDLLDVVEFLGRSGCELG
jgi:putative hydrolase of the HAD superfamily